MEVDIKQYPTVRIEAPGVYSIVKNPHSQSVEEAVLLCSIFRLPNLATLDFATFLRYSRVLKDLSQTELARMAGIQSCQVSNYESSGSLPSEETLEKLASALGEQFRSGLRLLKLK